MIGKLVRHIEHGAVGLVVEHFKWNDGPFSVLVGANEGYRVKFLKPIPPTGDIVNPIEEMIGSATSFEVINEKS